MPEREQARTSLAPARRRAVEGPLPLAAFAALAVLALVARLPGLDRSLWYDELFTLRNFADSLDHAEGRQIAANNHPPASLIAWATERALGGGSTPPARLRAPFVVLGALAVVALAAAVSGLAGRRAGLVAAGLGVVAPAHVLLSQQVRGYAGLLVAASLLPWLVARALACTPLSAPPVEGGPARPDRTDVVIAFVAGFGLWFHATLALPIVAWIVLALLAPRLGVATSAGRWVAVRGLTLGLGLGALLLAPILPRLFKHARAVLAPDALQPRLGAGSLLELVRGKAPGSLGVALATVLLALAAGGLLRALGRPTLRRAGLVLVAPVLAAVVLVAARAPDLSRFALFALPGLLGLAGLSAAPARRSRRAAVATAVAALSGAAVSVAVVLSSVVVARQAGEELQDVRAAVRMARERVGSIGLVIGAGPGGELISGFDGAAQDEAGWEAALSEVIGPEYGPRRPVAVVVPFPRFTPRDVAPELAARCDALLLPGSLESPVLVWVARDAR